MFGPFSVMQLSGIEFFIALFSWLIKSVILSKEKVSYNTQQRRLSTLKSIMISREAFVDTEIVPWIELLKLKI